MKFLIIYAFTFATAFCLPEEKIKSRNIVVPVGKPEGRISNGLNARKGQFPYQAGLLLHYPGGKTSWCGGTLISNTDIITAAHCVYRGPKKVIVILGTVNRNTANVSYEVHSADITIYPNFNPTKWYSDIAIIKIPYTNYTTYIEAAELPSASISTDFRTIVSTGWGRTSDYLDEATSHLQYAERVVFPNDICEHHYQNMIGSKICLSGYFGVSSCKGDSGGPLVLHLPNRNILVGIESTGPKDGCEKNLPTTATRVASFLDWIKENSKV